MDTQRLILFLIFAFSGLFLWEAWQKENAPPPPPPKAAQKSTELPPSQAPVPQATPATGQAPVPGQAPVSGQGAAPTAGSQTIQVKTDLYTADIDSVGGVITQVALDKHRDATDPGKPYLAMQRNAERVFVAQAGLIGDGMPNHRTVYTPQPGPREFPPGADKFDVKLEATAANGDKVVEILTFHRGSYVIDVAFQIANAGTAP